MIPPAFEYAAPKTLPEAIALLGKNPEAKVLAGGHSLIPAMKIRLSSPAMLIDINRIHGLSYLREDDGWLKIGAMTCEADLDHSDMIQAKYPLRDRQPCEGKIAFARRHPKLTHLGHGIGPVDPCITSLLLVTLFLSRVSSPVSAKGNRSHSCASGCPESAYF